MKTPFIWDNYSNQPYPLKDKKYKQRMRQKNTWNYVTLLLTNVVMFPMTILSMYFLKGVNTATRSFYGMGVDLDKGIVQKEFVEELGVKYLLVRMPLWKMDRIDEYVEFVKSFGEDKQILLNILQDREHIEDQDLLKRDITIIFDKFSSLVQEFQVGNAINRTKWGFFSMDEYMKWYIIIQTIRNEKHPNLKLIGSSIIDFEFHYTIKTLFNFFPLEYDKFSSLLYVDRRGSPHNKQMFIFDTKNKINMLYSMVKFSPKTSNEIYITEVNWPLSNTAPYAPTSEAECVSEEKYSQYMVEYYSIAKESKKIQRVYWHQLIAAGYGLVDDRNGVLRKTPAFEGYKRMIKNENIE